VEERLAELERLVAFQDDQIQKLRETADAQEKELFRLRKDLDEMRDRYQELSPDLVGDASDEPPPPHY